MPWGFSSSVVPIEMVPIANRRATRNLRNSTAARYEINKSRMVRLAEYSRDCPHALRADTGIQYSELTDGAALVGVGAPQTMPLVRIPTCLSAPASIEFLVVLGYFTMVVAVVS